MTGANRIKSLFLNVRRQQLGYLAGTLYIFKVLQVDTFEIDNRIKQRDMIPPFFPSYSAKSAKSTHQQLSVPYSLVRGTQKVEPAPPVKARESLEPGSIALTSVGRGTGTPFRGMSCCSNNNCAKLSGNWRDKLIQFTKLGKYKQEWADIITCISHFFLIRGLRGDSTELPGIFVLINGFITLVLVRSPLSR